jgi:hypothetical protein
VQEDEVVVDARVDVERGQERPAGAAGVVNPDVADGGRVIK